MFVPAWPGQVSSLGYQVGPLIEEDLGITLTGEQQDRLIDYYQIDPVTGRRQVRRAAIRRPKGAGKSPEAGYCGYAELVLPVVFDGWTQAGQPIAVPRVDPWVQFAAVSEDQTDNVLVWLFDILNDPDNGACAHRGINLGRTRMYLDGRPGRLEPVTASAGSREGQRVTFAALDQTESWFLSNGGVKLAGVLQRNAAKMGGWSLELQNAPELGDGSVADRTAKAAEGKAVGVMFDTREPPNHENIDMTDPAQLLPALRFAYGEAAAWVDLDRLVEEILDPATDPNDAKRYYLNVAAPSSDWAFDRPKWRSLGGPDLVPKHGTLIVAGFDGSRHDDATAIVACEVETGVMWTVGCWERPDDAGDEYEHPESEIDDAVAQMFADFQVWRMYCDPPWWESTIAKWSGEHMGSDRKPAVVNWWTNRWRPIGNACQAFATAIRAGEVTHHVDGVDSDDVLTRHVCNVVKRTVNARDEQGKPLWTMRKAAHGRKIDAAMAAVLAWEARTDAVAAGVKPKKRGNAVFM